MLYVPVNSLSWKDFAIHVRSAPKMWAFVTDLSKALAYSSSLVLFLTVPEALVLHYWSGFLVHLSQHAAFWFGLSWG
jgi:hypothetical protein